MLFFNIDFSITILSLHLKLKEAAYNVPSRERSASFVNNNQKIICANFLVIIDE